ncbi:hypothetical protein [Actinoplanes utahensis]|uniref:Uncharacterized protein n=1 Tax=Actinoplanes utahensis TaxID=1869 RepID=A0A0A6UKD7_ACTUT|nr:hypothetical protein [Actinoplanes utahensis]KHD75538.1 hypothetical protein MB27_22200 [Actinoplanes utahensis]GIF32334.1 hypothetical protein Aut01nite_53200 [Actinoplanes utahensis]
MTSEDHAQPQRYVLEPDPAWDWSEEQDGVFVVELSWVPDALAGRLAKLVVSPALAADLESRGVGGFRTGPARGLLGEDSFAEPGTPPPPLLRLIPGEDPAEDIAFLPGVGLTVSERALEVLRAHCGQLQSTVLPAP